MPHDSRIDLNRTGQAFALGDSALANSGVIHVHPPARRTAVSGYLLQVAALAATELLGRERELAELAAFCTDDRPGEAPADSYWRWSADPWAGKSALLAEFVLAPPAGVDVVAFFITSRLARQNDAAAFCEVVQRQLYALLGEEEPLSTPHTRDEQMLLALHRAARQSADRGRRLVLVVDGLDEDRGVTPGPECHSIAALLPRIPPHDMRIVVAGRPHPPVPGDVPADHPLRTTGIDRRLEDSPHAKEVRWHAEQGLMLLLEPGGPGRELVGLTVAAGGGLSARDLAELTGSRPRLVERELSAVGGRSFQLRSPYWTSGGPQVYLLAHEEIRRSAADLITERELTDCRNRLHAWAQRYRSEGWPAATPEYLLRGYHQLLRELGDSARLVETACDAARHERLWQVTGADRDGLAEVAAAMERLRSDGRRDGDHDTASFLRLAVARDRLHDRTASLPEGLVGLWARLGDIDRAVNLAVSRPDSHDKDSVVVAVAEPLAAAGDLARANELIDALGGSRDRSRLDGATAKGLAKAGLLTAARQVALRVEDEEIRAAALVSVVESPAGAEHPDPLPTAEAITAVDAVRNSVTRTGLRSALAAALSRLGDVRESEGLVERAVHDADREPEAFRRAQLLAMIAQGISTEPRFAAVARELADRSAELSDAIDDPDGVGWVFPEIAAALAATGRTGAARALVDRFLRGGDSEWNEGMVQVGRATARAGNPVEALRLIARLTDPGEEARVLHGVGEAQSRAGETEQCLRTAERAIEAIGRVDNRSWRVKLLVDTADLLLGADLVDAARAVATAATDLARDGVEPWGKVDALVALALALEGSGQADRGYHALRRARTMAEQQGREFRRVLDVTTVAKGLYGTGRRQEAESLVSDLLDEVRRYGPGAERFEGLARVAKVFGAVGEPWRAGELAREILESAHGVESPFRRKLGLIEAVGALLAAGEFDGALELSALLPPDDDLALVEDLMTEVVEQLVKAGDLERAEEVAESIWERGNWERSIGRLAAGRARLGEFARSITLLNEMPLSFLRDQAAVPVVREFARAGLPSEARELADTIGGAEERSRALAAVAASFGADARGRGLLVEALALGRWDRIVPEIARVAGECLPSLVEPFLRGDD